MRVCGIDLGNPGGIAVLTDESAHGVWCLCAQRIPATLSRLDLQRLVHQVCQEHRVDLVATERPGMWGRISIGMAQREKQGLVRAVCESLGIALRDYQPQEIKRAVTGYGRASKEQVGRCVRMLVRLPEGLDEHQIDAVAIALVALNRERARRKMAAQRRLPMRRRAAARRR